VYFGKRKSAEFPTLDTSTKCSWRTNEHEYVKPIMEMPLGDAQFYICLKDDYSKYNCNFFITTSIKLIYDGMEFDCGAVQKVLEEFGITHPTAGQYTPTQNSEAEQENCTTVATACSMLHASGLLKEFGAET
jgi:hypothetical protein